MIQNQRSDTVRLSNAPRGGPTAKKTFDAWMFSPYASVRSSGSTRSATIAPIAGDSMSLEIPKNGVTRRITNRFGASP